MRCSRTAPRPPGICVRCSGSEVARRPLRGVATVLYAVVVAAILFLLNPSSVDDRAYAALRADRGVIVTEHDDWIALAPAGPAPARGIVFYPGGHTDPRAYLPTWAPIAKATGTAVFVPRMPLHFAPLDSRAAGGVIAGNPNIPRWWVGGHSFGGFAATAFLDDHALDDRAAARVEGLVLWAAYPVRGTVLREDLRVLVISGGRDGIVPTADARAAVEGLPSRVRLREIDGMEHSQFGAYRSIFGDGDPTISDAAAHAELAAITAGFLGRG